MEVLSIKINYRGFPIKIEGGKVFGRAFGTTINNHSMHWSWMELKRENWKKEFKEFLDGTGLL